MVSRRAVRWPSVCEALGGRVPAAVDARWGLCGLGGGQPWGPGREKSSWAHTEFLIPALDSGLEVLMKVK